APCGPAAHPKDTDHGRPRRFPADRQYSAPRVSLMQPGVPVPCAAALKQWTSFYCPAERTIYLYQPSLDSGNSQAGYAGMHAVLAHEWTHHVQFILGVAQVDPQIELQADCGAGLFLAAGWPDMARSGLPPPPRMLPGPSDPDHGPPPQGLSCFDAGYLHGAAAHCELPLTQTTMTASTTTAAATPSVGGGADGSDLGG